MLTRTALHRRAAPRQRSLSSRRKTSRRRSKRLLRPPSGTSHSGRGPAHTTGDAALFVTVAVCRRLPFFSVAVVRRLQDDQQACGLGMTQGRVAGGRLLLPRWAAARQGGRAPRGKSSAHAILQSQHLHSANPSASPNLVVVFRVCILFVLLRICIRALCFAAVFFK